MASKPLTRTRAILELALAYTLILVVIWTPNPWQRIFYIAAVIALALILILSFQSARALGLQLKNLGRSLWVAIIALILAAIIILIAAHEHTLHNTSHFIARYWGYALWALVQQILLQDVFLRRLLILIPSRPYIAALAAATLFASAHLPNPILTPLTLLWGFISCLLFLHYRNIIPLAIAHAAIGIALAISISPPIIHNMRVGLGYLRFHPHHHYRSFTDPRSWVATLSQSHRETPTLGSLPFHEVKGWGIARGARDLFCFCRCLSCCHPRRGSASCGCHPHRYRSHIDHTVSTNVCVTALAPTLRSRRHALP